MKRRVFIAAVLLTLAALVAAACGGDDELTVEEYFEQIQAIADDSDTRSEALDEEFERIEETAASNAAVFAALSDLFPRLAQIFRDSLSAVEELEPPSEVEDGHEEFVEAFAGVVEVFEDVADRIGEVGSEAELDQFFESVGFEEGSARFERACFRLEGAALRNGINLDLDCEDE